MRYPERKPGKAIKEEGLTSKDKKTLEEVMHRDDEALKTLSQM